MTTPQAQTAPLTAEREASADTQPALVFAIREYRAMLHSRNGERARAYLSERGITDATISRYQIGYAPNEWNFFARRSGPVAFELLEAADLVRPRQHGNGWYDVFRGRIMLPYSEEGRIVGFSGRILPEFEEDTRRYNNSRGMPKSRLLYGWDQAREAIAQSGAVYLVEGQIDTLAMASAGQSNVLGIGRALISRTQAAHVAERTKEVILVPDGDATGRRSILMNAAKLADHGVDVRVAMLNHGKDPGEVLQSAGARVLVQESSKSSHILEIAPSVIDRINSETEGGPLRAEVWSAEYIARLPESEHTRLLALAPNGDAIREVMESMRKRADAPRKRRIFTKGAADTWLSDEFVRTVREEASLEEVARRYTELTPTGDGFKGCCPAHRDTDPSLHLRQGKGFHCFGCGFSGGNAIDFVMRLDNVDFPTAVRRLAEEFSISVSELPEQDALPDAPNPNRAMERRFYAFVEAIRPFWREPSYVVREIKDLAIRRGVEEAAATFRREAESFGERTEQPLTDADADRIARAYLDYEATRQRYVTWLRLRAQTRRKGTVRSTSGKGGRASFGAFWRSATRGLRHS